ncbi:hypothetical protein GPECTOR_5g100 [Gonium pectorale]|uniref:SCD domain-containing protein n=1 Tax=Gonium pectorale TaxID=33097 RepID=A0A150GWE3_GONPE|nr:hypothetical protein GPECTOR_5g100 [Gonium pectorale]|eukprot:KXZ53988.1 hypothetical protein GPECTOR_5g100 [Gonium pectorale]
MPAAKRRKVAPLASLQNLTLWDIITKHPASVERAAKEWVQRYCDDKISAMAELMSMIVQAGGSDCGVSEDDLEAGEMDDVVKRLVDTIVRDGGSEPFRDKKLRNLRASYEAFWAALVSELHATGHLLDDHVCERLNNLLTGLSVTKVRGYRHAGTLTAGLLVTGWVRAQQQLQEAISTTRHQEEAAQRQKKAGADKKRVIESLQRQAEAAQRQVRQLKSQLEATFTAVFAVRFRDVGPEIRAVVIDLIGRWIGLLPATFMVDQYIKYVAWALSDRDASVRAIAVSRLLELFGGSPAAAAAAAAAPGRAEPPAHMSLLRDFVSRFTPRFKELPYDIDEAVAVLGVRLLTRLVAIGALTDAQLPPADCYRLLVDNPPAIRRAAAELAAQLLREDAAKLEPVYAQKASEAASAAAAAAAAPPAGVKGGKPRRGGRARGGDTAAAGDGEDAPLAAQSLLSDADQRKQAALLGAMLDMMMLLRTGHSAPLPSGNKGATASPLEPEMAEDLVDALFDRLPVLRSWKLLVDCLSDDLLAQMWGPVGLAHLAQLLAASVKRTRTAAQAPPGLKRQVPRARGAASEGEVLLEASQVLLAALPGLLRRHQTDAHVVSALVALLRDLKLELFSLRGDEAGWQGLLRLVGDQLSSRGSSPELLTQCADTLVHAPSAGVVMRDVCEQLAAGLATAAGVVRNVDAEDLAEAVADLAVNGADADAEELVALRVALLRTHAVLSAYDASDPKGVELDVSRWTAVRDAAEQIRGGAALAADPRVFDALDELLAGCGSGRLLGPELTSLLAATQLTVLLNNVHQVNSGPSFAAAAAAADGGPGPSGSGGPAAAAAASTIQRLLHARDSLVSHLVAMHSAAADAAHAGGSLQLDDEDGDADPRVGSGAGSAGAAVVQDAAYRVLSDVALVFGSKSWASTPLEPVCMMTLSEQVANLMWRHCAGVLRCADTRPDDKGKEGEEDADPADDVTDELEGPRDPGAADRRARRAAAVAAKLAAIGCLGRLLAHDVCGDHHRTIAIKLTAEFCNHGPEVADLIRDVCREMAAARPHGEMPQVYTGALRQSWAVVTAAGDEGEDAEEAALQNFKELAEHISGMYAGHGTSRGELLAILRGLTDEAFVDAPTNLAILAWGAESFVPKLAPEDASILVGELEGRLNDSPELAHEQGDSDWAPMYHYLGRLKEKATKGRVAPRALKGASATTPKAARNRKISFAPSPRDRDHPEDEEEGEEAEEERDVSPPKAAKRTSKAKQPKKKGAAAEAGVPTEGAWLQKAVRAVRKPAAEEEEEEEEEEEVEDAQQRQAQRRPAPVPARPRRGAQVAFAEQHEEEPEAHERPAPRGQATAAKRKTREPAQPPKPAQPAALRRTAKAAAATAATNLRAIDLDAGPHTALTQTQTQSQSQAASQGPSLLAVSDMAVVSEGEEQSGSPGPGPSELVSDLQTMSAGATYTSGQEGESEQEVEEQELEAPEFVPTEEELPAAAKPRSGRAAAPPAPQPARRRAAAAPSQPQPSASLAAATQSQAAAGSLQASDADQRGHDEEEEEEEEEAEEQEEEGEEEEVQMSDDADGNAPAESQGRSLVASEGQCDQNAAEEPEEDEEGEEEGGAEEEGEDGDAADAAAATPSSSRKRRYSPVQEEYGADEEDEGEEQQDDEVGEQEGEDEDAPLAYAPSESMGPQGSERASPQPSYRSDSMGNTQDTAEPPPRLKRRRRV